MVMACVGCGGDWKVKVRHGESMGELCSQGHSVSCTNLIRFSVVSKVTGSVNKQ